MVAPIVNFRRKKTVHFKMQAIIVKIDSANFLMVSGAYIYPPTGGNKRSFYENNSLFQLPGHFKIRHFGPFLLLKTLTLFQ